MTDRPDRAELVLKFFPEMRESNGASTEGAIALNVRACEAILADLIDLYDDGLKEKGRGVLTLRLFQGAKRSEYVTSEQISADLAIAKLYNDEEVATFIRSAIDAIADHNTEKAALIAIVDNGRAQLIPIDREYPAAAIQSMLKEAAR